MKMKKTKVFQKNVEVATFEKFLARDIGIVRLIGLHSMNSIFNDNDVEKSKKWETVLFGIPWINVFFVVCFICSRVIDRRSDDLNYTIGAASTLVSGILVLLKGWRLWYCQDELCKLLRRLGVMWDDANHRVRIRKENLKTAARTYFMGKLYIITLMSLSFCYCAKPYIRLLHYHWYEKIANVPYDYTVYPARYPWSADTLSKYIICVSWEQFSFFFAALYSVAANVIFIQLTTHVAIQFRVLQHDLKFVWNADDIDETTNKRELIVRLSNIAKRHHDLYTYCEIIERIFNPIIFVTLLVTGASMCLCSFHLQKEISHGNWTEAARGLLHTFTVTIGGFIYCGYADKLTQQSSLMARAAYECQWTDRTKEFNVMLHIIMLRSQRPFVCTAYGFFSVNLARMTAIFNAAGSYFMLLQSLA